MHLHVCVWQVLKECCSRSCATIMTIHQPPAKVFALFDKILLLNRRGELVYFGPMNQVVDFFKTKLGIKEPEMVTLPLFLPLDDTLSMTFCCFLCAVCEFG
jgi:ABC-type multidrug transport system ATPase subunit